MREYGTVALRVTLGAIYLFQAYLALFASTPRGTAAYMAKLGLPVPTILAVLVIAVNGLGGAMLVMGLWARIAAGLNALILVAGLFAVYVRQGVLNRGALIDAAVGRDTGSGYEYVALLAVSTILLTLGAGGGGGGGKSR